MTWIRLYWLFDGLKCHLLLGCSRRLLEEDAWRKAIAQLHRTPLSVPFERGDRGMICRWLTVCLRVQRKWNADPMNGQRWAQRNVRLRQMYCTIYDMYYTTRYVSCTRNGEEDGSGEVTSAVHLQRDAIDPRGGRREQVTCGRCNLLIAKRYR